MAQRLWNGIKDCTRGWTIVTEQTVARLQGLKQPEEQIDAWQRAWNEVDGLHLEGEEVQADADMTAQRKRPDAWVVSWENQLGKTPDSQQGNHCNAVRPSKTV